MVTYCFVRFIYIIIESQTLFFNFWYWKGGLAQKGNYTGTSLGAEPVLAHQGFAQTPRSSPPCCMGSWLNNQLKFWISLHPVAQPSLSYNKKPAGCIRNRHLVELKMLMKNEQGIKNITTLHQKNYIKSFYTYL